MEEWIERPTDVGGQRVAYTGLKRMLVGLSFLLDIDTLALERNAALLFSCRNVQQRLIQL